MTVLYINKPGTRQGKNIGKTESWLTCSGKDASTDYAVVSGVRFVLVQNILAEKFEGVIEVACSIVR